MSQDVPGDWLVGPDEYSHLLESIVAIGISKSGHDQLHARILYTYSSEVWSLDFGWHYQLNNYKFDSPVSNFYWVTPKTDNAKKRMLAVQMKRFYDRNSSGFPYAPGIPFAEFNEDEELILDPKCVGFTCSSFVALLFSKFGLQLVDFDSWESRPEDESWKEKIVSWLSASGSVTKEHVNLVASNAAAIRIRPEEVVAAAGSDDCPCNMDYCEPIGIKVFQLLK